MVAVKPKNRKDDLHSLFSLSLSLSHRERFSSLTHAPQSVSACVIIREAHSLFIFFHSLETHSKMSASLNNYLCCSCNVFPFFFKFWTLLLNFVLLRFVWITELYCLLLQIWIMRLNWG